MELDKNDATWPKAHTPDGLSLSHMVGYQVFKIIAAVAISLYTMVVQMMKVAQLLSLLTSLYDL